ncbi:MAG: 4-(cytidine 5'-diphospho)-2-C-methyl-D-erythritol kinase [Clostridia bacterium]|nr:4-(cytidine 5'-diphospho)-2-C-methyl-D-erythritol kinase [Clostridia bacterium]
MNALTIEAPAKINLYLASVRKRPDGYHEIESVMQQIGLYDLVSVTRSPRASGKKIAVHCSDPAVPRDARNIVWKCAEAFFEAYGIGEYNLFIDIEKHIPSSAGLAGGSSDGAATLKALNLLFGVRAETEALMHIGAKIGADIPFCLAGGTCLCRGIGERITPLAIPKPSYAVLVAFPGSGISTAEAYRALDAHPAPATRTPDALLDELASGRMPASLFNDFERVILPRHPAASQLRDRMTALGASSVLMSGSGPSVFGLFPALSDAREAQGVLRSEGIPAWAVRPL